jgi:hypothetical protein
MFNVYLRSFKTYSHNIWYADDCCADASLGAQPAPPQNYMAVPLPNDICHLILAPIVAMVWLSQS